jgi:RNA polymerase sigma factor (sigma-70 family)
MNENRGDDSLDLLARWREGDQQAADILFHRYANRLIALARSRLSDKLSHRIDPEDVVQSAYRSFFRQAQAGRYDAKRGGDLWRLLLTITLHKLQHQVRGLLTQKRSATRDQDFGFEDGRADQAQIFAREPSPIEAVALTEQVEQVMRGLDPEERRMLELRLQGFNFDEIATETQCGERTVRRFFTRLKANLEHWRTDGSAE